MKIVQALKNIFISSSRAKKGEKSQESDLNFIDWMVWKNKTKKNNLVLSRLVFPLWSLFVSLSLYRSSQLLRGGVGHLVFCHPDALQVPW